MMRTVQQQHRYSARDGSKTEFLNLGPAISGDACLFFYAYLGNLMWFSLNHNHMILANNITYNNMFCKTIVYTNYYKLENSRYEGTF